MAKPISVHTYKDPVDGEPFARKLKYPKDSKQRFAWERRVGWDEWAVGLSGIDPGLYNAHLLERAIKNGLPVHLTEGEKDADALLAAHPDWIVTSVPDGAGVWKDAWRDLLLKTGKVTVYADDDEAGLRHAAVVSESLRSEGQKVAVVLPAEGCKDVAEHLEAGHEDNWRKIKKGQLEQWMPRASQSSTLSSEPSNKGRDAAALLSMALLRIAEDSRNGAGLYLAVQLRDNGFSEEDAKGQMLQGYVPAANASAPKSDPYTPSEALESVKQAYSREAREPLSGGHSTETWDDFGNAQRLVEKYGDRLRWVADIKQWAVYEKESGLWILRSEERALGLARKVIERAEHEEAERYSDKPGSGSKGDKSSARSEFVAWVKRQRTADRVGAMLKLAKSKKSLKTVVADFDGRDDLLHCANGVLDLRSRELLPFSPEHLCTVSTDTAYLPSARDALWDSYLDVFLPNLKLRKFVQRVFGYSLIEGNPERLFTLVCGGTSSGKSTINEAVMAAIGGYARPFNLTVFRANKDEKPRSDVADILHRRYVSTVEASADWHLHADQIKRVTGGDKLAARYPWDRADTIRVPAFAPFIFTNAVPTIEGRDKALDRRLMVLPFNETVSRENDVRGAREKLAGTDSAQQAVLAWLVAGLAGYHAEGGFGTTPKVVKAAIEEAKFSFSDIDRFFKEQCEIGEDLECRPAEIYEAYRSWCYSQSVADKDIVSNTKFGTGLANRGYEKVKGYPDGAAGKRAWVRRGLRLKESLWRP